MFNAPRPLDLFSTDSNLHVVAPINPQKQNKTKTTTKQNKKQTKKQQHH